MLKKEKSVIEGDPKKRWSEIEAEVGVEQKEVGLEVSLEGSTEKKRSHICSD